jgi:hypothetical protein
MIVAVERWFLRPEFLADAVRIMQEMDDFVGPNAHAHPGWVAHAKYYQAHADPLQVMLVYPWASVELHRDLLAQEVPLIAEFESRYFSKGREVFYLNELDVWVE